MLIYNSFIKHFKKNKLFKDSFWAVFGNGTANALMLITGIFIARLLGKDIYGEYGFVKTTMFQIAALSTFGLGYTSTKFIAQYVVENPTNLRNITKSALSISCVSSVALCILLIISAEWVASFVGHPQMVQPFRYLGLIVITRALSTVCSGLISGYKNFYRQGINNIISGVAMLLLAPILTYNLGLSGSLLSLLISQLILSILHIYLLVNIYKKLPVSNGKSFTGTLIRFSIPVAMQEFTFAVTGWGIPILITKYANLGELGIYSVAAQWDSIILFIPSLLSSVVISYLSTAASQGGSTKMFNKLLLINFICALIPFLIVVVSSKWIAAMYGPTFVGLQSVINILVFSTIFSVLSRVYQNEMISQGLNWQMFFFRAVRDITLLGATFCMLKITSSTNAALKLSILIVIISIIYLISLVLARVFRTNKIKFDQI